MIVQTDILCNGVLYCSVKCAKADNKYGGTMTTIEPKDYYQSEYGALCPVCEYEYHCFAGDEHGMMERPQMKRKIYALLSKQGTACHETVLYDAEYTPENRMKIERYARLSGFPDAPVPGTWTDVSDNDAFIERRYLDAIAIAEGR